MAGLTAALGLTLALLLPAQAQFWSPFSAPRRPPGSIPQQPQSQQYNQQYNPFGGFFTPQEPRREAPVDYSHAPAAQPRHTDVAPTTPVVVVGDAMADWLAYGLEDAFADEADISIVPITEDIGHAAVAAFDRYGRGRGAGGNLNFGDCLSYACTKAHGARLLFKGHDFAQTDIACA